MIAVDEIRRHQLLGELRAAADPDPLSRCALQTRGERAGRLPGEVDVRLRRRGAAGKNVARKVPVDPDVGGEFGADLTVGIPAEQDGVDLSRQRGVGIWTFDALGKFGEPADAACAIRDIAI